LSFPIFLKELRKNFVLHAVAAHFNNGLLPAALLFLFLSMFNDGPYFEHTVLHLIVLALCMIPVSFISGIRDWRTKFRGGRAPIFYRKMWLSGLLFLEVGSAATLRLTHSELLVDGFFKWLYIALIFGTLPVVVLLGHYGAKLAFELKPMR